VSWSRRFDEPIELPDGRKLKTLAEAMAWLAKESRSTVQSCSPGGTSTSQRRPDLTMCGPDDVRERLLLGPTRLHPGSVWLRLAFRLAEAFDLRF